MILLDTITAVLPPPLRGRVGEGGSYQPLRSHWARNSLRLILGALFLLACLPAHASEREERWRLFKKLDGFLLAASHSDEATDDLGAFFFRCKARSGMIEVEGTAKQDLRAAMADFIRAEGYPQVHLLPTSSGGEALLNLSYSEMSGVWQYSFAFPAIGPTFDEFKRTGQLVFKVGAAIVREEFKAGLESAVRFQDVCKPPPKRTSGQ